MQTCNFLDNKEQVSLPNHSFDTFTITTLLFGKCLHSSNNPLPVVLWNLRTMVSCESPYHHPKIYNLSDTCLIKDYHFSKKEHV